MIWPGNITIKAAKEWIKKRNEEFSIIFVSGSNIHPNPTMYKYYFWIYSMESKENSAKDVFYKKEYQLSIAKFEKEVQRLKNNKISFAYVNRKYHRLGSIFNYEKLKEKYPEIEFAPAFNNDIDEMNDKGHK